MLKEGEVERKRYPAHFHQLGDHDDAEAVLLPHHPPEVVDHLLLGACGGGGGDTQGGGKGRRSCKGGEEG